MTETRAIIAARYLRKETLIEVFATDERGPEVRPVQVIRQRQWVHIETNAPVTDPAEIARLDREYPATLQEG